MLRRTAVWGDEKDKFSSSKLWKTKWRILPREEIPEEWLADKYQGMWSRQTETPEQFKEQWEAGAIRVVQFTLKLDVGRFGSYTTPLVWERGIFLFAHAVRRRAEAMVKNGLPITTRNLIFEMVWQAGRTHASLLYGSLTEKDKSMEMFENSSLHSLLFAGAGSCAQSSSHQQTVPPCPSPIASSLLASRYTIASLLSLCFRDSLFFRLMFHPCDDVHLDQALRLPAERARLDEQSREYYQRG